VRGCELPARPPASVRQSSYPSDPQLEWSKFGSTTWHNFDESQGTRVAEIEHQVSSLGEGKNSKLCSAPNRASLNCIARLAAWL
jgi:hypothetical protein